MLLNFMKADLAVQKDCSHKMDILTQLQNLCYDTSLGITRKIYCSALLKKSRGKSDTGGAELYTIDSVLFVENDNRMNVAFMELTFNVLLKSSYGSEKYEESNLQ